MANCDFHREFSSSGSILRTRGLSGFRQLASEGSCRPSHEEGPVWVPKCKKCGLGQRGLRWHKHQCCNRDKISRNIPVIRECTQVPSLLKQRCRRSPVFNPATSPNVFPSPSHPDPTKRRPLSWPLVLPRERSSKARRIFPWIRLAFTRAPPCHHLPSFPSVHSRVCFLGLFSLPALLYLVPSYF